MQKASVYATTGFLYYSSTTELLSLPILVKGSYLSFNALLLFLNRY
jgi:hypothetical protein